MRVVVSGVTGFVGQHLAAALVERGHTVVGIGQGERPERMAGLLFDYQEADLTEGWPSLNGCQGVVHLAARAAVGPSFANPQSYVSDNCAMVTNLGEAQLLADPVRTLIISSGAVLSPHQPMPLDEGAKFGFASPYAVSKVAVENFAAYYRGRGLDWTVLRPFNHLGPGQLGGFLLPDLHAAANSAHKNGTSLAVGNLATRRDYTDVRDVVEAYVGLLEAPAPAHAIYNICSGSSTSGWELLDLLLQRCGWPDLQVEVDFSRLRPQDPPEIVGTAHRLQAETGWKPTRTLAETVDDFVSSQVSYGGCREVRAGKPR